MTRQEADQIAVYLSTTYGPWSDGKKALFAGDIIDLPFERALEAATLVKPKAKAMREKVFDAIKRDNGLTCDEVCAILRIDGNSARPRIRELVIADRVIDSGQRRPTDNGRKAIVWRVRP